LKSPIALVGGYAYLLETHEPLMNDPIALDYIDSLKRGAERMSSLVNDMLDLLQMETRQELVMEPLQLATVLEDAAIDFRLRAEDKQIALSVNLPPEEVNIYADNDKITRVIDNLLSNAIKYTPPGGKVTMTGKLDEGMVLIEVNDTGSGIPKKDIPNLFEPFYRVKSIKQAEIEGTGLGLSIVKSIVDKHKGSIEIESTVGEGSTFRVSLPIYMRGVHKSL
ncbi:MAG: sensor histidine kinase, partial [Aggregatilineales bacterium]